MNRKYLYLGLMLFVLTVILIEPTYCQQINDNQIRAASNSFIGTLNNWMPVIVATGLFGSGICLFASNFRMGIAGLAGTGFLYASRAFVNAGNAAVFDIADQILQII